MVVCPFTCLQIFHGFVFHFQSLKIHNAQVLVSCFPDLALLQLKHEQIYCENQEGFRKSSGLEFLLRAHDKILRGFNRAAHETAIWLVRANGATFLGPAHRAGTMKKD